MAYPKITTVSGFIREVLDLKIDGVEPSAFRGQADISWSSQAPIFRENGKLLPYENTMAKELLSVHPQEFLQDETMFDRLVRMQHYGLPTRLLDVTLNPLVALFFAAQDNVEKITKNGVARQKPTDGAVISYKIHPSRSKFFDSNSVSILSNLANLNLDEKEELSLLGRGSDEQGFLKLETVRYLLRYSLSERSQFGTKLDPVTLFRPLFVRPKNNNRRIIAQSGAFIIYGLDVPPGSEKPYEKNIKPVYFRIPAEAKETIRKDLSRLGIDASVLFPELEKSAQIISSKYRKAPHKDKDDFSDLLG